jgi:Ser-tRNA(Ala) deacylase AlaX
MKKNYDPRMHSAEHILNQTMDRMYQCGRCFNAHIERKKSKCDYHFEKALKADEIEEIQSRVNRMLPDDVGDRIRIISIGDYDHCPCIGPHVKSSAEIGEFRITSSAFEDGVLRIRYKLEN